jgi:hypothetical protein
MKCDSKYDGIRRLSALSVMLGLYPIGAMAQRPIELLPAPNPETPASVLVPFDSGQQPGADNAPEDYQQKPGQNRFNSSQNYATPKQEAPAYVIGQYGGDTMLTRRMADRTRQILVLRRLLALHFSAEDIAAALPLLRSLQDIKAAPPVDPETALEREYEALLAAGPNDPLPPSSADKIIDAAHYYRDEQDKIWSEMTRRIGRKKSDGLYNLLGQQDALAAPIPIYPGNGGQRPDAPLPTIRSNGRNPSSNRSLNRDSNGLNQPGNSPFAQPRAEYDSGSNRLEDPRRNGARDYEQSQPETDQPDNSPEPVILGPQSQGQGRADLPLLQVAPIGRGVDPRLNAPGQQPFVAQRYNSGANNFQFSDNAPSYSRYFTSSTVRVSLSELIELMTAKLRAMHDRDVNNTLRP